MPEANIITEHMGVVDSDGVHVGIVDHLGEGMIKLTKAGAPDGQHHYIATAIVQNIRGNVVRLTKPAALAIKDFANEAQRESVIFNDAEAIHANDPHKTEKLTKLGHEADEKAEGDEAAEGTEYGVPSTCRAAQGHHGTGAALLDSPAISFGSSPEWVRLAPRTT